MNLSHLSEAEMISLLLNQEKESAIGDMHSQQSYREHLEHEALNVVSGMWGELLAESGGQATRKDLEDAFAVFFDLVLDDHNDDSLPFSVEG